MTYCFVSSGIIIIIIIITNEKIAVTLHKKIAVTLHKKIAVTLHKKIAVMIHKRLQGHFTQSNMPSQKTKHLANCTMTGTTTSSIHVWMSVVTRRT